MTGEEIEALTALSRSRTEPAGRVSRAAMLPCRPQFMRIAVLHGTLSLLAGIDLLTGKVHALVRERHRSG
jgi:hypothetical protein